MWKSEDLFQRPVDTIEYGLPGCRNDPLYRCRAGLPGSVQRPCHPTGFTIEKEGRIRHLGVSSHNPVIARKIVETGLIDVLLFSINPCYDMQPASEDIEDLWADQNYAHALHNIDPDRENSMSYANREA